MIRQINLLPFGTVTDFSHVYVHYVDNVKTIGSLCVMHILNTGFRKKRQRTPRIWHVMRFTDQSKKKKNNTIEK